MSKNVKLSWFSSLPFRLVWLLLMASRLESAENSPPDAPQFMGAASCSSTGCHGGAAEKNNQNIVWSKRDFHSRAYATLTSARSERFAAALQLGAATQSPRCTVCHAPFQSATNQNPALAAEVSHGVSCESCHGPAEPWLRSHTRPDFVHEDRVAAGLRDLKNLYVRANTCVACHQTLPADLAAVGHPELLFEMDGQSVAEPKHWRDPDETGPQAWLVGQAAALREMSWQLSREARPDEKLATRWSALGWLLQQVGNGGGDFPDLKSIFTATNAPDFVAAQKAGDALARHVAAMKWTPEITRQCLIQLSQTASAFKNRQIPANLHARRAERLVLGLDRLSIRLEDRWAKERDEVVSRLFKLTQSLPNFSPEAFAQELEALALLLPPLK